MLKFLIWLCLLQLVTSKNYQSLDNTRRWFCTDQSRCIPYKDAARDRILYSTQNICRLSCGRYGSLWPQPTGSTLLSHGRLTFDPKNLKLDLSDSHESTRPTLNSMYKIFQDNIAKECRDSCSTSTPTYNVIVNLTVQSDDLSLTWDTDESYTLMLGRNDNGAINVNISAITVYGARHGLEAFSQLLSGPSPGRAGLITVSAAKIRDKPAYRHRGLLLDTARNFMPMNSILKTLDAMATSKMNVFHWHATDSHSFPLEIIRVPEMHTFGAYSPENVYRRTDVEYIIDYAKLRGIRVLIELDGPSHAGNGWQWGPKANLGDLALCINQQPWRKYCIQPPCGQINPINWNVYSVLNDIYQDIADMLPQEETLHMGGDEVFFGCWNASTEITSYLRGHGLDTSVHSFLMLWGNFHTKNLKMWDDAKKLKLRSSPNPTSFQNQVIVWSSHLTDPEIVEQYLPADRYIIQTWVEGSSPLMNQLLEKNYKLIVSTKDAWYLDHGFWGATKYYDWRRVYQNRLQANRTKGNILGGEVCMWSEYVDENSLDPRVWPRAGAAAERLWSDPETDSRQSEPRFFRYRERLIARGINPDAVTPKWCTLNDGECI